MSMEKKKFYIVPTPIGNLEDMTLRALRILKEVDIILCEDTRVTKKLLQHFDIHNKNLLSYHAQSSEKREVAIIERIKAGEIMAIVSDAGTPTISDPGARLIAQLYETFKDTIEIIPLPGATALIPALSACGFFGNQFTFYGFLPHKKGREKLFQEMKNSERISIFYESPHRILKTLQSLNQILGEGRKLCIVRELTKIYEEKKRGNIHEILSFFEKHPEKIKGEFVVVIEGKNNNLS